MGHAALEDTPRSVHQEILEEVHAHLDHTKDVLPRCQSHYQHKANNLQFPRNPFNSNNLLDIKLLEDIRNYFKVNFAFDTGSRVAFMQL